MSDPLVLVHEEKLKELIRTVIRTELKGMLTAAMQETLGDFLAEQKNAEEAERRYTIKAACDYLGISKPTLHRHKKKGEIQFIQNGGRVYFKKIDLDKFDSNYRRRQAV